VEGLSDEASARHRAKNMTIIERECRTSWELAACDWRGGRNPETPAAARPRSPMLLSAARGLWDKLWGAAALPRRNVAISEA